MKDYLLPMIAIGFSIAAIGFSLNSGSGSSDARTTEQLELRIAHLESRLARQVVGDDGGRTLSAIAMTDELPAIGTPGDIVDLRERQEELESYLNQLGVFEHFESFKQKVTNAQAVAMDHGRTAKERIEALSTLREAGKIDGDVVTSMLSLWDESFDEDKGGGYTRYFLLENLEGVEDLALRDTIIDWVPNEESAKMRARGIETIAPMREDPMVDEWLVHLSENDPEPKIQQMAAEIRAREPEGK